jgi:mercuric ion transport protein
MTVKAHRPTETIGQAPRALAIGALLAALAAASCCIVPVVLFGLGISGAWIANLTQLAPYKPLFVAAALASVGGGYWLMRRTSQRACTDDAACARPLPTKIVTFIFIAAMVIVLAAFGFDYLAPYLLS